MKEFWQCEPGPERWALYRGTDWEIIIDQCPLALITPETGRVYSLFHLYREGRFPITCEVMSIPEKMYQAFKIIERYLADMKVDQGA